jgi:hypothetical protein
MKLFALSCFSFSVEKRLRRSVFIATPARDDSGHDHFVPFKNSFAHDISWLLMSSQAISMARAPS